MKRAHGFTLIEMVITVIVAIVLLGIAIPSFRFMMANSRATAQANALFAALNYARSEAIGRKARVTVCAKNNANTTETECGANTNWNNGWHAFVDNDSDGAYDVGEVVLKHWGPLQRNATVTTAQASIGFMADGSRTGGGGEVTVDMSEAESTGDVSRCVRVAEIGMVRVHRITATATCP